MNRNKRRQVATVILGILAILVPIFISPFIVIDGYFNQYVLVTVFVCIGLPVIWHGVYGEKFKNRKKEPPRSSPMSDGAKTGLVGVGVVFFSLFVGTVGLYAGRNPLLIGLFVLLFIIGAVLLYASSYMTRKEREAALRHHN